MATSRLLHLKVGVLIQTLASIYSAKSAPHSLKYFYTAVTPGIELPEFTAVGTVDEEQFMYYDSNSRRMIPKTEWINESEAADYWERETHILMGQQQTFSTSLRITMEHFNHAEGVHTLQDMFGCEWGNETGTTARFDQYGYDGEDFISLSKSWKFIALVPEADFLIQKWNDAAHQLEHRKQFLTHECVERLKKYVRYRTSSLERTVPPQVSLLQKNLSFPVTCHVTGFYPGGFMVTWQKDGEELYEGVELEKTVPNGDGTFQTRSHLRVKPEDWKRDRYTCTVQHKSLEKNIILPVTEKNIKTNNMRERQSGRINPESSRLLRIIIGCVVGALLLLLTLLAVLGVCIWRKRSSGCKKTRSKYKCLHALLSAVNVIESGTDAQSGGL